MDDLRHDPNKYDFEVSPEDTGADEPSMSSFSGREMLGGASSPEVKKPQFPETVIPDQSIVTSQIGVKLQGIQVHYSELTDYFDWIRQQAEAKSGEALIMQAAKVTSMNLHPGEAKWDEVVAAERDLHTTLGQAIKEDENTCFHRAIFFNLMMQQVGIPCQAVEGEWFENSRADLHEPQGSGDIKLDGKGGLLHIGESNRTEKHLWNMVELGDDHYLVDASYFTEKEGKKQPVIQKVKYDPDGKYFTVPLPKGETRHYVSQGTVKVHTA